MRAIRAFLATSALLATCGVANAGDTFDFVSMANSGEKGFASLGLSGTGYAITITGTKGVSSAFAYLDAGHGGLGVCGVLTSSFQCTPGNDDNVTTGEVLSFVFSKSVSVDSIWFNNNHDGDGTLSGNQVKIAGMDYGLVSASGVPSFNDDWKPASSFLVAAGVPLLIRMADTSPDQFYVSGMTVTAVPEPETYALLLAGLGLLGISARRRRS